MFCDTSAFIDYLRRHPVAVLYFQQIRAGSEPASCSVITETELWAGVRNVEEELEVLAILSRFNVIPVNRGVARLAGTLLRSVGEKKAHFGDALIAATAVQLGETILTADRVSDAVFGSRAKYLVYR